MVEDVAEEYLEELIHRSMIQVAGRKWDGRVKSCRIHDLLRDLAISKAKDSKKFEVHRNIIFAYPFNPRRLIAHDSKNISQHLHTCRLIRSLICSLDFPPSSLVSCLRTKLLTVLDLTLTEPHRWDLPKEIGEFIHLKYFSFKNVIGSLPWSIGPDVDPRKVTNLRVLKLMAQSYIGEKMTCSSEGFSQLEFLRLKDLYALEELKVEERAMPSLKTLQIVLCYKMKTLLHELLKLKNLQRVNLESMDDELIQEIETTEGEEYDKIRGITSIIKHHENINVARALEGIVF
ncbi:putative disease resistance RPP13-like protein 3 [Vitis vinifera]|uniref:Putative disease resistance RPP13-like protein 3 n=1 Tax=Vitis vinifera TaxID=29760 RepID=A0A438D589_VITVI|nr:putative disease resistance RPP13-like protein 3 [Vitis vinifera]